MRWVIAMLGVAACTEVEAIDPPDPPDMSQVVSFDYAQAHPVNWTVALDLLIVVDTSPAMAAHRERLVESYRRFGAALEYAPGLLPDLHVGVVTADPEDGAVFRRAPSVGGEYVVDSPISSTQRELNYGAGLGEAIAQLADAGSDGGPEVRAIDAMRVALATDNGFRRPDAYLLVVFVAASDDASATSVDAAAALLGAPADRRTAVSVIAPDGGTACAPPATRLLALADRFGDRRSFASLCGAAHEAVLSVLSGGLYQRTLGQVCARELAVPFECAIEDMFPTAGADAHVVLAPCDDGAASRPCWRFAAFEDGCDGFTLHVDRSSSPVLGTRTRGQCVAAP